MKARYFILVVIFLIVLFLLSQYGLLSPTKLYRHIFSHYSNQPTLLAGGIPVINQDLFLHFAGGNNDTIRVMLRNWPAVTEVTIEPSHAMLSPEQSFLVEGIKELGREWTASKKRGERVPEPPDFQEFMARSEF